MVILRLGSTYGPGRCSNAVAGFLDEALATQTITVWGDPERRNQYVHVADLSAAAAAALTAPPGTYNLTNGEITTSQQLADTVAAATGAHIRYERDRPTAPPFPFVHAERAHDTLGWNPRPLATGITDLLAQRTAA